MRGRPNTSKRDRLWQECVDLDYMTPREIADFCGYPLRTVQAGIKRARGLKLDFATVWDICWLTTPNVFIEASQCELHDSKDIPRGLAIGCLYCLRTGLDYLIRGPSPAEQKKVREFDMVPQPMEPELEPPKPKPDNRTYAQRKFGGRKQKK